MSLRCPSGRAGRRSFVFAIAGIVLIAPLDLPSPVSAQEPQAENRWLEELAPEPARQAIATIPDEGRRLLALRSYLRSGARLPERWSWNDEQIAAFEGSPEQEALVAAVALVSDHFAERNPGYTLYANTNIRSLETQIARWNENESVGSAAAEIQAAFENEFGKGEAPMPEALGKWLIAFRPAKPANLAAPGLSLHGRGRAIDFQVMQDDAVVAGTNSREIESEWRSGGWEAKLKASMDAAGPSFSGPLTSPDEPWHYNYTPEE